MKIILLIEDNEIIRENSAEILELAGYKVIQAENGKSGVDLALLNTPDLVICDIMMPVLDGYGVLQIFSQNPQLSGIPFIFLTAKTERSDLRRGMELGADDYLTKPFDESELLGAVASRIQRFKHLRDDYDLKANGLNEFLDDAKEIANLKSLSEDRRVHYVSKKQVIYQEGEAASRLYFLKSGRVKTVRTAHTGKEFLTKLYQAGEFFGYLALLEGTPHHDSAIAVDDSELIYIPREDFSLLLMLNPKVGHEFICLLAGRVSEREQQLLTMAYSSIRRRVADTLISLQGQTDDPDGYIRFSRDDLAAMIGTAPETLTRTLSEFKQDGLVELTVRKVKIIEPEKLRRARW